MENNMKWWQLTLFGVGCTIGTGFFLGSSIAIDIAGPSVLISYVLAAFGTYFVFDALAKMTAEQPLKGTFRAYAKHAFGHWAGFSVGWVYWSSELLIMGSQLTALSIFSQFWFPNIPLWLLACVYAVLALIILLVGVNVLNKLEDIFAVIKTSAILMFIVLACLGLFGALGHNETWENPRSYSEIFPRGATGLWSSLIFAFYAYGGIEVMGLMATKLKNPHDAPKAGKMMLGLLGIVYSIALLLVVSMVPWGNFKADESPLVTALDIYHLSFVPHVFNGALIIAGFSTMVASLYAVTTILISLAEDHDAPAIFAKKGKLQIPVPTVFLTIGVLAFSILMALLLPDKLYEYVTTAAGLMLLYNWFFILLSSRKILKKKVSEKIIHTIGLVLIILGVSGTMFHHTSRPGFFISIGFVAIIGVVALIMNRKWKKQKPDETTHGLAEKVELE